MQTLHIQPDAAWIGWNRGAIWRYVAAGLLLAGGLSRATAQQSIPQNPQAQAVAELAQTALARKDIPAALESFRSATKLEPAWPDGWWFLGSLEYRRDECDAAKADLSRFLALSPGAGPALALRGMCGVQLGQYPEALADITQALAAGAGNTPNAEQQLRFQQAQLLTFAGRYEAAIPSYAQAARVAPLSPQMLAGLGLAGLRVRLMVQAIPEDQRGLYVAAGTAGAAMLAGDEGAAKTLFTTFFRTYPTQRNAHFFLGYLLFTRDPVEARAEFREELKVEPHNASAQMMMAWAFLQEGDAAAALPFAADAARSAPESGFASLVAGRSLVETGNVQGGLRELERSQHLEPENLDTHLALATAYARAGRSAEARAERLHCLAITAAEAASTATPTVAEEHGSR